MDQSTTSTSSSRETKIRKKRIKPQTITPNPNFSTWKSEKTQQLYSTKLIAALRHVRTTPPSPAAPRRSRAVREAADKALAVAAKGRSRWSRAILTNKIKLKYLNQKHKKQKVNMNITGASRLPSGNKMLSLRGIGKGKELLGVEKKVKTLGRLVPGCKKESLPVILEEATDYIPALEMQIRAMRDLLLRLTAVSTDASASDSGSSSSSSHVVVDHDMV